MAGESNVTQRLAIAESGGACAFPECSERGSTLEIAHIVAVAVGGTRYDPSLYLDEVTSAGNLIVLCANHHRLVDTSADTFTVDALLEMKRSRAAAVARIVVTRTGRLEKALNTWDSERKNQDEGFWQALFQGEPSLLAPLVFNDPFVLLGKCYVGGKQLNNSGANLLDFLALGRANVTLIEIKTPTAQLMATQYRENVWTPAKELIGGTMQVLEYRSSLLRNLYSLKGSIDDLDAVDPPCIVLIGDLELEGMNRFRRRSFESYRQALRSVTIVTYDELFRRLRAVHDEFCLPD